MTQNCRHYIISPIIIITIYIIVLKIAYTVAPPIQIPTPLDIIATLTGITLIILSIPAIIDAVKALGGPRPYFCGGIEVVRSILSKRMRQRASNKDIVTWGPFQCTRHPVYTATITITIGIALIEPRELLAILVVITWVYAASLLEEMQLETIEAYKNYKSRTSRFSIKCILKYGVCRLGLSRKCWEGRYT